MRRTASTSGSLRTASKLSACRHRYFSAKAARFSVEQFGDGFFQVSASYGFMESPDVPALVERLRAAGVVTKGVSFFVSRETLLVRGRSGMARWRLRLFAFLSRNASSPALFFRLPANQVVELGKYVEM